MICSRCIMDTSLRDIRFDEKGVCNLCHIHDRLDKMYPLNEEEKLNKILRQIKIKGKNKKYDCIVGVSGGRDSIYTLYLTKELGLRPLAVHYNEGWGNPIAGENIKKAIKKLNVDLVTITANFTEAKDLRISCLKASIPDLELGTDLGIVTALYGVASKENISYVLVGFSFRTEGLASNFWNYVDGKYLYSIHKRFGTVPLKKWERYNPRFNLRLPQLFYYILIKRIKIIPILSYVDYVRKNAEKIMREELDWVYPGAHYFDDLYQSLMSYVLRVKFKIDKRRLEYSALIRSKQMMREEALKRINQLPEIEEADVIRLCIERLGISQKELNKYIAEPPKTFLDYPSYYRYLKLVKLPIKLLCRLHLLPESLYEKF